VGEEKKKGVSISREEEPEVEVCRGRGKAVLLPRGGKRNKKKLAALQEEGGYLPSRKKRGMAGGKKKKRGGLVYYSLGRRSCPFSRTERERYIRGKIFLSLKGRGDNLGEVVKKKELGKALIFSRPVGSSDCANSKNRLLGEGKEGGFAAKGKGEKKIEKFPSRREGEKEKKEGVQTAILSNRRRRKIFTTEGGENIWGEKEISIYQNRKKGRKKSPKKKGEKKRGTSQRKNLLLFVEKKKLWGLNR